MIFLTEKQIKGENANKERRMKAGWEIPLSQRE
jgi:hypothetical protein